MFQSAREIELLAVPKPLLSTVLDVALCLALVASTAALSDTNFAAAFERFRKVAPPEARKPCFWGGAVSCFERYRPAWVVDG